MLRAWKTAGVRLLLWKIKKAIFKWPTVMRIGRGRHDRRTVEVGGAMQKNGMKMKIGVARMEMQWLKE